MRFFPCMLIVFIIPLPRALGQSTVHSDAVQSRPRCHTTYDPPVDDGAAEIDVNWTNGLPRPGDVACVPADSLEEGAEKVARLFGDTDNLPFEVRVVVRHVGRASPAGSLAVESSGGPPSPTTVSACCLGSACVITDYFDCRQQGGYFREGLVNCFPGVCDTGACCTSTAECLDDDGVGGGMDEEQCGFSGGTYLGGAPCDTDPCERFRIPKGFEIVEAAPGTELLQRLYPRFNNCGNIVFNMASETTPFGSEAEIYLYDNGALSKVTDDAIADVFPDINDKGTIVWTRPIDDQPARVVMLRDGRMDVLDPRDSEFAQRSPRLNALDHVVWRQKVSDSCPGPRRDALYFYNGVETQVLFDDGLSNQGPAINDLDEVAWTNYTFPCGGGFGDWTSERLL